MKSVIIKQKGKKIIHIKEKDFGFEADVVNDIKDLEITVINNKNERIKAKYN